MKRVNVSVNVVDAVEELNLLAKYLGFAWAESIEIRGELADDEAQWLVEEGYNVRGDR